MIGGLLKSASSVALFAALGLIAAGGVSPAKAADLGGDCCADLEERVAELEATTARKGNRKVSLTISGQVTTGVLAWDDGHQSNAYVVDNTNAGATFFVLSGNAKINPSVTAGFDLAVTILAGARSQAVSQADDDGGATGDSTMAIARANWYLDHAQLGRLTVGRINTASAGVVGIDLGGIGVVANANVGYWNAGFETFEGSGVTWGALMGGGTVFGAGLARSNAISYTSPTMGGFSVSAAWGEDDLWDAALRYAGEFSGFRLAAAIAYANNVGGFGEFSPDTAGSGDREISQIKGSASLLHTATGLFVQGSYLTQDNDFGGLEGHYPVAGTGRYRQELYRARQHRALRRVRQRVGCLQYQLHQLECGHLGHWHRPAHRCGGHGAVPVLSPLRQQPRDPWPAAAARHQG